MKEHSAALTKAASALERMRQRMIAVRNADVDKCQEYNKGDLVKVTVKHFPIQVPGTQVQKLQQLYVGPFEIEKELHPGVFRLKLPYRFTSIHNAFNEADLRPWKVIPGMDPVTNKPDLLPKEEDLPKLLLHHAERRIAFILDRKAAPGKPPKDAPISEWPCQYLVRYQDQDKFHDEWLASDETAALLENSGHEYALSEFERKYPRLHPRPCKGVSFYRDPTGIDVDLVVAADHNKLKEL
jgi:hypothetical protein